jgi:hypothetical protein
METVAMPAMLDEELIHRRPVVLDIGEGVGALVVHTSSALVGREIEISPRDNAARRTHVGVLLRDMGGRCVAAAVFPTLPAGAYSLWRDVLTEEDVVIQAGGVVERDWRHVTDADSFRLARPERLDGAQDEPTGPLVPLDLLPPRYRQGQAACPAPMGAAPMRYADDGRVAWDQMWTTFCDLALAGGPKHRPTLLEPGTPAAVDADPDAYATVVAELARGLGLVTELPTVQCPDPGWLGLRCDDEAMARWLLRAIAAENISVRRDGVTLWLPAAPTFRLDHEIKNVVTVVAKTHHYWREHRGE